MESQSGIPQESNGLTPLSGADDPATPQGLLVGHWAPGLIALLGATLYLGTLRFGFVWDDLALIVQNQFVRRLTDLPNWLPMTAEQTSFGHFSGNLWRPGVFASMAVDFALWGERAAGFHLTNLLLHGVVTWLAYRLAHTVTDRKDLAIVTALLFAVHPTHVEAVAWISARGDLLVTIWMVIATLFFHNYLCTLGWRRACWYGGALVAMGAGLLFKEAATTLPPLLLLLEGLEPRIGTARGGSWARALLRSLPFWAIAVGHLVFLSRPLQTFNPDSLTTQVLLARIPGSLETLSRYAILLLFPMNMRPFYALPRPTSLLAPWPLAGAGLLAAVVVLAIYWRRRLPAATFGLGWFLLTVGPYLDLLAISPREMGLADRYLYLPSLGFLLFAAILMERAIAYAARWSLVRQIRLLGTTLGILLVIGAGLAARYMPVWQDNLSLYSQMVRDFPQAPEPHLNLGLTYFDLGEPELGIAELEKAVQLRSQWVRPQIALAFAIVATRSPADGFRLFDRIAAAAAEDYFYYLTRGRAHMMVNEPGIAADLLTAGLRRFPSSLELHFLLARARGAQGDFDRSIEAYRRVLALDPRLASAHEGLGRVLAQAGKYGAAAHAFNRALELQPNRISAIRQLALTLEADGRHEESLRLWRHVAARAQDPGHRSEALKHISDQPDSSAR